MIKETHFQLSMLSKENSLTLVKELINGGKSYSLKLTRLVESKFLIEKTVVEIDWQGREFILITNIVDLYQVVPKKGNGMMSNA